MATIQKRKNKDGSIAFMAWVRIKPFKPASQSFPVKKEAEEWADALERELRSQRDHGGVRADVTTLTIAQFAREYLDDEETKKLRYYPLLEIVLAWWVNNYGGEKVTRMNVLTLRAARDKLRKGRKPATVNRYLSGLRSCWNWGRSSGLLPTNFLWPEKLFLTEPKGRTRYLSDDELVRLLEASAAHSAAMHAAVMVSIGCGLRQSELLRLEWGDLDLTGKFSPSKTARLLVRLSKNGETRAVHVPGATVKALQQLKKETVIGVRVFIEDDGTPAGKGWLRYRWQAISQAAKLEDFRWHDLRHSCASFLAQQGANLLEIGSVLGHKSPEMTKRYSHLIEGAPVKGHTELDEKLGGKPS